MRVIRGSGPSDSGQALIEVALCMPVLLLLLAGTVDVARLAQFDMLLTSGASAGAHYGAQNATAAADLAGMVTAATNDAPNVTATASSYYWCAGSAPPTPPPVLTKSATAATHSSANCSPTYQLLYVVVTTSATFKPILLSFLGTGTAQTHTAIMQVGS